MPVKTPRIYRCLLLLNNVFDILKEQKHAKTQTRTASKLEYKTLSDWRIVCSAVYKVVALFFIPLFP